MVDLGTYIAGKVREAITGALQDSQSLLDEVAKNAGGNVNVNLGGSVGSLVDVLVGAVLVALAGAPELIPPAVALGAVEGAAGPMGKGFGIGYFLAQIGFQLAQPATQPWVYDVNRLLVEGGIAVPQRIDAATAARMWATGIMQDSEAISEGADLGFDRNRITQLYASSVAYPDVGTLLEAWRRGWIAEPDVDTALIRHGLPLVHRDAIKHLAEVLVSPADLALAALRGNISVPDAQTYAQTLGVSAADLDILIGNTGEPPGLETMQLMLRRGVMTPADFERGVRYSRVRNEYIPFLDAIRTGPPSTEAAIKASVENYIGKDQAKHIGEINGLDPQYFDFVWDSWGEPISKTEALTLFNRGKIGRQDVVAALKQGRTKDIWIPQVLELQRSLVPIRQLLAIIQHGIEPPQWGVDRLMEHGYSHEDAAALVSVETSGRAAVHKQLAESMITEAYEARAIGRQDAIADLGQLGWTEDQAAFILDLGDAKVALAEQKKAQDAIRKAYLSGRIDDRTAGDQLKALQMLDSQVEVLKRDWKIEREGRVLELTPADIAQATLNKAIGWHQALRKLVDLGYTDNDAGIFLAANKVPVPEGVSLVEPAP